MPLVLLEKECGPKCRSHKHVQDIISFIVRGSLKEFQAYSKLCHNWTKHTDTFGRTALHVAASCGKTEILRWLLEETMVDVNQKDLESGYTALHRALYSGQLACARLLMQFKADIHAQDAEGLNSLDIAMLDRLPQVVYSAAEPNDAYTWGENNNSTLGHASPNKRTTPEAVDFFKKMGVSIKQIVLCKYHCVFLTQTGHVYTCGHGPGGRLGHGDQHTVLVPRLLESVKIFTCLEVAAANDHTLLRMEKSIVFSFGLNQYHQLGQSPYVENSPLPKQMNVKSLKGKTVSGICVGRFHSVVWTPDGVYTVGLNAGHLGHQVGEKFVSQLHQVSSLRHTDIGIANVACSDAAIVCLTTKGDIFLLYEHQCRKIVSRGQDIDRVLITGGYLTHTLDPYGILKEKGDQEVQVMMKNESGQIFLWKNSEPYMRRCCFALKRQLLVSEVVMTTSCLLFSTKRGEAFIGYFSNKKSASSTSKDIDSKQSKELVKEFGNGFTVKKRLNDLLIKQSESTEEIQVHRIPYVHRAVVVSSDCKGKNFAVLQSIPNSCMTEFPSVTTSEINFHFLKLLSEAHLEDNIHDAVIQIGNRLWPIHKYIIAMRSDVLHNMVAASTAPMGEKLQLKFHNISPDAMEQIISYMYTDTCDYLQPGFKVNVRQTSEKGPNSTSIVPSTKSEQDTENFEDIISTKGLSAYQVRERRNSNDKKKEPVKVLAETKDNIQQPQNAVKMLQEVARKLGVKGLSKRLESVKCINGVIVSQGKNLTKPRVKFDREKLPKLYDVSITPDDGPEIQCHKCVLMSRLEYFYNMLSTGWSESFNATKLKLPTSGEVLKIIIDYLYTDEAVELKDSTDEELLCNVLIVADQLLAWRLKEMCEVALANTISFKNVSELLEFSSIYNADQLKTSCQHFVSINLSALIECRYLDSLSEETLDEVACYYRSTISSMAYRHMTPDIENPPQSYIDELVAEFEAIDTENQHQNEHSLSRKGKQQRKRNKSKKSTALETVEKITYAGLKDEVISDKKERTISCSSDRSTKSEDSFHAIMEEINRQNEEEEKKLLAIAEKTKQVKWRSFNIDGHTQFKIGRQTPQVSVPTKPEDIQKWTPSYQTFVWVGNNKRSESDKEIPPLSPSASSQSPALLSTSPTSFRDILRQESQSSDMKKNTISGRISWKEVKKQQSKDNKDKQTKTSTSDTAEKPGIITSTKAAWGSVGGAIKSFRDLMIEDKHVLPSTVNSTPTKSASPKSGSSTRTADLVWRSPNSESSSWGLSVPVGRTAAQAVNIEGTRMSTSSSEAENPWLRRATLAASPPSHTPISAPDFSAILRDEKEKLDTLVRTTQKPLALIQLEEKAMAELLVHYAAGREADHYITVERVSRQMAEPVWLRGQKSSSAGH